MWCIDDPHMLRVSQCHSIKVICLSDRSFCEADQFNFLGISEEAEAEGEKEAKEGKLISLLNSGRTRSLQQMISKGILHVSTPASL